MEPKGLESSFKAEQVRSASQEGDIRQRGGEGQSLQCPVGLIAQASELVTLYKSHLYLLISV